MEVFAAQHPGQVILTLDHRLVGELLEILHEREHDNFQSILYIIECQPRHVVQLRVEEISLNPDIMKEALSVLGGGAGLNLGSGGCLDPEVSDTFRGCSRRVTGGHNAVDQRNVLLGVADLEESK